MPGSIPGSQSLNPEHQFQRPLFQVSREFPADPTQLKTLPDLIDFNSTYNPDHTFALQEVRHGGKQLDLIKISFRDLKAATVACARYLQKLHPNVQQQHDDATTEQQSSKRPIALFHESDVTLFVHLAALVYLDIPVLMLSIRLSPVAIAHLLKVCSAQAIILSKRTQSSAKQALLISSEEQRDIRQVISVPYESLQQLGESGSTDAVERPTPLSDQTVALILHSSGTTGLPKPIRLAHRYLLGYAACHHLQPEECNNRLNVSTLPMYHGFGLLAPCLSLSTGKACCFPSGSTIPSALSVAELIELSGAYSLMTVPTILEEIVSDESYLKSLIGLDFVAVGGGAIKPAIGSQLVSRGVKLLNHYGATEIGAIAPIFCPGYDYDWRYLRLRDDMALEVHEVEQKGKSGETLYQLTGFPFGWDKPFVVQDILERRSSSKHIEVKILGRGDDLIVLSTGEKVLPQRLEEALASTGLAKAAIVFGEHRPEVGVIVEPTKPLAAEEEASFIDTVWDVIQRENKQLDRHARVASKTMVLIKPTNKTVPRSDKGSVMRKQTYNVFQDEIEAAYNDSDEQVEVFVLSTEPIQLERDLRVIVQQCVQDRVANLLTWGEEDDFFSMGMDSLEATRLARALGNIQNKASFPGLLSGNVKAQLIYQNSSIRALARALQKDSSPSDASDADHTIQLMKELATTFSPSIIMENTNVRKATVLLTGSTGHLGVYLLKQLLLDPKVERVICLNRSRKGKVDPSLLTSTEDELKALQLQANVTRGITVEEYSWKKVRFLPSNHFDRNHLGLPGSEYDRLKKTVTHVIHNAWPMDFQRALLSFTPHIRAVRNLIDFTVDCYQAQQPSSSALNPRLLVLSSIAVCARNKSGPVIAETPITDPSSAAAFGYPQAKWVCESLLVESKNRYASKIQPIIIRLGQLTGARESGLWNPNEHFPAILKASQSVGSLPNLNGTYSWIPVDIASTSILEILLTPQINGNANIIYHVENPVRQPWEPLISALAIKLNLKCADPLPFDVWLEKALTAAQGTQNLEFLGHLRAFLESDFRKLSSGELILDTSEARKASRSLRTCNGVGLDLLDKYIASWRKSGFLQ